MKKLLEKISFFHLKSNIRKTFIFRLTTRRNFLPILSIYFLTFPNTEVNQIGLYTSIGTAVGFLLEIPSGYIADRIGHKKSLILCKISFALSTIAFLVGGSFLFFVLGSIFIAIAFAFSSGTQEAFMHETLEDLGRGDEYTKVNSRISGNVSLLSVFVIIGLPFLIEVSYRVPFWVALGLDIVGILTALSLIDPKVKEKIKVPKSILTVIKELKGTNFVIIALYSALLGAMLTSASTFKEPYVQSIGYPVAFIGLIMGLSRLIWFGISRIVHIIEKNVKITQLMLIEAMTFGLGFVGIALIKNPFIVGAIFSLLIGYQHGRRSIFSHQILKHLPDKKYKATALSVLSQVREILRSIMLVLFGYLMDLYSFQVGFLLIAGILLFGLGTIAIASRKILKTT